MSYKKRSVKDRHRAIPWHNLEFLGTILAAFQKSTAGGTMPSLSDSLEFGPEIEVCGIAIKAIISEDLPELRHRLSEILLVEEQINAGLLDKRTQISVPPPWGLKNICKLTGYFMDCTHMESILYCLRHAEGPRDTRSKQIALLRVLAVVGELSKYMTDARKSSLPNVPWKNVEKVREAW
jgi:uncharacterized protein with HEPN domain